MGDARAVRGREEGRKGRIVSTLEGGYALPALGRSAAEHVKALIEA
jgi:acetoin utilization deacetylase AcuC-like enzyme